MINSLETAKFSIKLGDRECPRGEERECHCIVQEYWREMAVPQRRTHQWQTFAMSTAPVDRTERQL